MSREDLTDEELEIINEAVAEKTREDAVDAQLRTMHKRAITALYVGVKSMVREGGMTFEEALDGLDSISEDLATDFEHWWEVTGGLQ